MFQIFIHPHWYFIFYTELILRSIELFIYIQTLTHIQLKNKLWTAVTFLHCCNLIWGLANNNYSLYFLQFLTRWQFTFVLYFHSLLYCTPIYSWTIEQIDRDNVLLLKITQIWVITICVVLDHNTVNFKRKMGVGVHIKITGMQDSNSQGRQK